MHARFDHVKAPWLLLPLLLGASCAKDHERPKRASGTPAPAAAPAVIEAEAEAKVSVTPALGGSVFLVGRHQVELAVHADGNVDGLVFDAEGKPIDPTLVADFSATLAAEGAARPRVKLLWDDAAERFHGQAALEAALVARPIDVSLQIDGALESGVLASYELLPKARVEASASALADVTPPAPAASAKAKLAVKPQAKASVKASAARPATPVAAAKGGAQASASVNVPKPKVEVAAKTSAGAGEKTGAKVKAKASFGFGN